MYYAIHSTKYLYDCGQDLYPLQIHLSEGMLCIQCGKKNITLN